jgi:xanthine dehydrogenase molybdenum-binding subunit
VVYAEGVAGKEITVGEVAEISRQNNWGTIAAAESFEPMSCSPSFMVCFVEVEVNTRTGEVKPVRAMIGCDSGTVVNPELAEGQLHGGFYRGAGFALLEDTVLDCKTGELLGKGYLTDFKMLTASDLPHSENLEVFFADTYERSGPFGAKGIAEVAINPIAAAFANAVYNATGVRFREIPITPEKVLAGLKERRRERG